MNEVETLGKIATDMGAGASALTKSASALDEIVAKFKEPKAEAKVEEPKAKVEEARALAGITKTEVWGIPIGQIAVGTFGGVFISELADGFLAAQSTVVKGGVKLGLAAVTATWGKRWLGKDVSYAIAFVLGVFGLSQILPIDKWAASLAGSVKGILPGTIKVTGMQGNVLNQAQGVAENYYARLGGAR